ncbi:hypothetical protein [Acidihalobacter prosperus]|uniref:Lipoprotein n=1 Tax=Acidihalobacter prosperus TaxID=160660 RepID=A0A1A6C099_9GAMM|nr:hypothetical protein [Acidihalobacter prosperus]OBS07981.1 hypothetical protein Thpro_022231 [Acidihalobacter prosperus]
MTAITIRRILAVLALLILGLSLGGCFYYPDDGYGYGYYGPPIHRHEDDGD